VFQDGIKKESQNPWRTMDGQLERDNDGKEKIKRLSSLCSS